MSDLLLKVNEVFRSVFDDDELSVLSLILFGRRIDDEPPTTGLARLCAVVSRAVRQSRCAVRTRRAGVLPLAGMNLRPETMVREIRDPSIISSVRGGPALPCF